MMEADKQHERHYDAYKNQIASQHTQKALAQREKERLFEQEAKARMDAAAGYVNEQQARMRQQHN